MIISLTTFKRGHYLKECLDALKDCEGIQDVVLFVDAEPDEYSWAQLEKIDWCDTNIQFNEGIKGPNENTEQSLHRAFAEDEYVVHLEEDMVLSPDALRFFKWAEGFKDDPTVFSVSSWNLDPGPEDQVGRRGWFSSSGAWAMWRDRWTTHFYPGSAWDTQLQLARGQRDEIAPALSRCRNIGQYGGTFTSPDWWALYQDTKHWATCRKAEYVLG